MAAVSGNLPRLIVVGSATKAREALAKTFCSHCYGKLHGVQGRALVNVLHGLGMTQYPRLPDPPARGEAPFARIAISPPPPAPAPRPTVAPPAPPAPAPVAAKPAPRPRPAPVSPPVKKSDSRRQRRDQPIGFTLEDQIKQWSLKAGESKIPSREITVYLDGIWPEARKIRLAPVVTRQVSHLVESDADRAARLNRFYVMDAAPIPTQPGNAQVADFIPADDEPVSQVDYDEFWPEELEAADTPFIWEPDNLAPRPRADKVIDLVLKSIKDDLGEEADDLFLGLMSPAKRRQYEQLIAAAH